VVSGVGGLGGKAQAPPPRHSCTVRLLKGWCDVSRRSSEERPGIKRKNGLQKFSGTWEGFVDIPLSPDDKERLAALSATDYPDIWEFFESVLSQGYKFSITRDEAHNCDIATLTGKGEGCINKGYSLSARGPGLESAILALWYKHVTLCEEQRWEGHANANSSQLSLWG